MANPKLEIRISPIMHAYLKDLADIGVGKGPNSIARRFIENGIAACLETKVILPRKASEFKDESAEEEEG